MAIDIATARTEIAKLYIAAFNRVPDSAGLDFWVDSYVNKGQTLDQIANNFTNSTEYATKYPSYQTTAEYVEAIYVNVFGRASDADGKAYWVARLTTNSSAADYLTHGTLMNAMVAAAAANGSSDGAKLANQATFAVNSVLSNLDTASATAQLANVTADTASITTATTAATTASQNVAGQTYTLTVGTDSVTGTSANDTINGGTSTSWSAFDTINGGAGTDTMTALLTTTTVPGLSTITNVETLNVNTSGAGFTIDTTTYTGMTAVNVASSTAGAISVTGATTTAAGITGTGASNVTVIGTGGNLAVTTGSTGTVTVGGTAVANAITAASVTGGSTVAITDRSGTAAATGSTLKTVSITSAADDQTITANGLTTLNLTTLTGATTVGDTTVTAAAGTRALTVNYNGVDVGGDAAATAGTLTMTDATATSLAITNSGAATYDVTTATAAATAVTVNATAALQMDAITAAAATTLGISGTAAVTITADTLDAAAIVTSTNTGGVTLTQALTANQQFVGTSSSGNDSIGVATAFTKAISTGAGNDTVTYAGPANGGTIDAGEGTDTIAMTAAVAVTATGSTTFAGTVSNFEKLELNAATGAAAAINMANADGINSLVLNGVTVGALTVTNAAANFTYTNKAAVGFASSIALASDAGTSDTVNVIYTATDGFADTASMTIANVENINITTVDADTTAQTTKFTANITAAAAKTVTISGDTGVTFTNTNTAITSLDASGLTGTVAGASGLTWTTGALAASSVIKGSAAATNTVDFSAANTASTFVTYTGGTGNDTITGSNALNNVVNLGNGTNSFTSTSATGNMTITGGTGVDTIDVNGGNNTISTGEGADLITVGAGQNVITAGGGNDTITFDTVITSGNAYSTIADAAAGDIIKFTDAGQASGTTTWTSTAVSLGGTAVFQDYLDAVVLQVGDASTNAHLGWFQFGGNTYIVEDNSNSATFQNGVDTVVKLTGLIDLSTATFAAVATTSGSLTLA